MVYNALLTSEVDANSPWTETVTTKIKDNFDFLKSEQDILKIDVNADVTAGSYEGSRNDQQRQVTPNGAWVKVKEFKLIRGGIIRITYQDITNQIGVGEKTQVYRNGVGAGSQFSPGLSFTTKSDDVSGWSSGDLLQIYAWHRVGADTVDVKNVRLHSDEGYYLGGGNRLI